MCGVVINEKQSISKANIPQNCTFRDNYDLRGSRYPWLTPYLHQYVDEDNIHQTERQPFLTSKTWWLNGGKNQASLPSKYIWLAIDFVGFPACNECQEVKNGK